MQSLSSAVAPSLAMQILGQLLLPLQSVVNFFAPPLPSRQPSRAQPPMQKGQSGTTLIGKDLLGHAPQAQVLRSRRAQDGRIVISGRMRDVCAELDRLCDERT